MVSVTVCCAEAVPTLIVVKAMAVLERVAWGTGPVEAPVRVRVCGELEALSVAVMVSEKLPTATGVKVKLIVQKEPAASTGALAQVLEFCVKSAVLPDRTMLLRLADAVPVFVTVTVCTALVRPTGVLGKVSEDDESVMVAVPGELEPELEPPPHPVRRERTERNATAIEELRSMVRPGS